MAASYFYTKTGLALGEAWQFHLSKVWVWWNIYYQYNLVTVDSSNIYLDFSISGDNGSTFYVFHQIATSPLLSPVPGILSSVGPTTAFKVDYTGSSNSTLNLQIAGR